MKICTYDSKGNYNPYSGKGGNVDSDRFRSRW